MMILFVNEIIFYKVRLGVFGKGRNFLVIGRLYFQGFCGVIISFRVIELLNILFRENIIYLYELQVGICILVFWRERRRSVFSGKLLLRFSFFFFFNIGYLDYKVLIKIFFINNKYDFVKYRDVVFRYDLFKVINYYFKFWKLLLVKICICRGDFRIYI